jgi:hypothetical protein
VDEAQALQFKLLVEFQCDRRVPHMLLGETVELQERRLQLFRHAGLFDEDR